MIRTYVYLTYSMLNGISEDNYKAVMRIRSKGVKANPEKATHFKQNP